MMLANKNYNLFDEFFKDPFFSRNYEPSNTSLMKTDILEKGENYQVEIELPGYEKGDVQAELKNGYLVVTAERKDSIEEEKSGKYICRERFYGTCKRSFYVGKQLRQEDISAAFENGILTLTMPKEAPKSIEEQPKLITIQ